MFDQYHVVVNVINENHDKQYLMSKKCRIRNHKIELIEAKTDFMTENNDV
jgi:hypothetical protein